MKVRATMAWGLAVAALCLWCHDATAFGRRGGLFHRQHSSPCPQPQYYCPPVPNPNDGDDNDPDMPPAPAKVPDVPTITDDTEPAETPNIRLFNDTDAETP